MNSRIQARIQLQPAIERERFAEMMAFALKQACCQHQLLIFNRGKSTLPPT